MNTVCFRDFEERDIEFIYRFKNDEKLNSMIVGEWHPFSYEEAVKWVHGCMGEHETFKFWAICANDEEKRIIGWVSLSQIDKINQCACFHGIVIGDRSYQDGFAWLETHLFIMEYAFERLGLNRLYGSSIVGHKDSNGIGMFLFWEQEGILRQAVFKNGLFYDLLLGSILKDEYFTHKNNGEYEIRSILKRIRNFYRKK
jgi:RimJ/RimL family protein N-acetyltransferase